MPRQARLDVPGALHHIMLRGNNKENIFSDDQARRKGQREEYDERILGSGDFVNEIFKEAEKKQMRQMKIRRSGKTIANIIIEECAKNRVSMTELQSGSRRKTVSDIRANIARRGLDELGLSMAEIARHVGVNTSSITRTIAKLEKKDGDSYAP